MEQAKRHKYSARCRARGVLFTPFAVTEFGVMGPAARALIERLADKAAGLPDASYVDGADVPAIKAKLRRRFTEQIARAVCESTDKMAQKRLVRSCGIAATLDHVYE